MNEPSLPDKVGAVNRALTQARIPHAFGGALALAYYAEPRATIDIDVNLFIPPEQHATVAAALEQLGVATQTDQRVLERDGQCRIWWGRTALDLFYSYDRLHEEMATAARTVPFADGRIPILAPEHLIVCKAAFDRTKDWIDIEQMVALVEQLDIAGTEQTLVRVLGADDSRLLRFQELVRDWRPEVGSH